MRLDLYNASKRHKEIFKNAGLVIEDIRANQGVESSELLETDPLEEDFSDDFVPPIVPTVLPAQVNRKGHRGKSLRAPK